MDDMQKVPENPPKLTPEQEKARKEEIARLMNAIAHGDSKLARKPKPEWWVNDSTEKKRKAARKKKRKTARKARKRNS
jgi:hypothetical protein